MNSWSGVGNLTKDPMSEVDDNGVDICKFTIAVNRAKNEAGESIADFIPIKAKGKRASLCREYLRKGRKVGIIGKLQTYNFVNDNGERKYGFQVVAEDITFLPSGNPNNTQLGDVHQDDGVVHNTLNDASDVTTEIGDELPF